MLKKLLPFLIICTMSACSNGDLTRSKASKLIEDQDGYKKGFTEISLSQQEVAKGVTSGLWDYRLNGYGNYAAAQLTAEGSRSFQSILVKPSWNGGYHLDVLTRVPANYELVEITGIRDVPDIDGGGKLAEYTYKLDASRLPDPAKAIFAAREAQQGRALFRHYDDGWRLERFVE